MSIKSKEKAADVSGFLSFKVVFLFGQIIYEQLAVITSNVQVLPSELHFHLVSQEPPPPPKEPWL